MEDQGRVRWAWVSESGQWGEADQLWLVDVDDGLVEFLDLLTVDNETDGIVNIARTMGIPFGSIAPPLPLDDEC